MSKRTYYKKRQRAKLWGKRDRESEKTLSLSGAKAACLLIPSVVLVFCTTRRHASISVLHLRSYHSLGRQPLSWRRHLRVSLNCSFVLVLVVEGQFFVFRTDNAFSRVVVTILKAVSEADL